MVRALALFVPVAALYDTVVAATRGYGTMRATVLIERVARPVGQLALLAVAALTSSVLWLTAAWALPYVPALAVSGVLLARLVRGSASARVVSTLEDGGGPQGSPAREFWAFTAPRSLATVAQIVSQRMDIVLLGALRGPVEAAIYTAATRFLVVGQTAGLALSMSAQPTLGAQLARGEVAEANRVYRTATAWLILVTWPLYLAMLVAAPLLLGVFGPGYDAGLPVVALLAGAMLVATACGMVDMVLTMAGRTTWNLIDMALALAVQIGLDLLLIPDYGIRGAAYGWAGAIIVKNIVALAQIRFSVGMHPFGRGTLLAAALSLACFGALPAAVRLVSGATPAMLAALTVGGAAYVAGLWWLREPLHLAELPLLRRGKAPRR
jgi:O-antigen/teichoic acid export membrane protein